MAILQMKPDDQRLMFEADGDPENQATFAVLEDGVCVSVSDEKAVDSYNHTFECDISLSTAEAELLRDWLMLHFPLQDSATDRSAV